MAEIGWRDHAVAAAFLLAASLAFVAPGLVDREVVQSNDVEMSDLEHQCAPLLVNLGRSLREGRVPFWSGAVAQGLPLLAEGQSGLLYLPQWPLLYLWPDERGVALVMASSIWIAGLGTYALCRQAGAAPAPALIGALGVGFGGYSMGHLRQVNFMATAAWLPGVLALLLASAGWWFGRDGLRSDGRALLCLAAAALAYALQGLGGSPPNWYIASLAYVGALVAADRRSAPPARRAWFAALAGLALLAGAGLASFQLLETAAMVPTTLRHGPLTLDEADRASYHPVNLLLFLSPSLLGSAADGTSAFTPARGYQWENMHHVGLVPLAAGLAAFFAVGRSDGYANLWRWSVVAGLALAFGRYTPVFPAARAVLPWFDRLRYPPRFGLLAALGLAVLGTQLLTRLGWSRRRLAALLVFTLFELLHHGRAFNPFGRPLAYTTLPPSAAAVLRDSPGERPVVASVGFREAWMSAYWRARGWSGDLAPYARARSALYPESYLFWGLASPQVYTSFKPRWLIPRQFIPVDAVGLLRALGTTHVVAWLPALRADAPMPSGLALLAVADGEYAVFRVLEPLGEAWLVGRRRDVADASQALTCCLAGDFAPGLEVLVSPPPERAAAARSLLSSGPVDGVRALTVISSTDTTLDVSFECAAPSVLVTPRTWYPGWRARLDDRTDLPVLFANGSTVAVEVPPGRHRLRLEWRSEDAPRAVVPTALGALVVVALAVVGLRARGGAHAARSP